MLNSFSFEMNLSKAYTKGSKKFIKATVSDTRRDYHGQSMSSMALDDMAGMLKSGYPDDDGEIIKVTLLDNHKATMEIGYGVDAKIVKAYDGALELEADFELVPNNPIADQLFNEVEAGKCKKQLSVGGSAMVNDKEDTIERIKRLEHVACTRPSQAAVKSTSFVQALVKSLSPLVTTENLLLKDMSTDDRMNNASIVRDNSHSTMAFYKGGSAYLLPIPAGDKNAAKVALNEMGNHNLTRTERKTVHDKAVAVLGSEHLQNDSYCPFCSSSDYAYRNKINDNGGISKEMTTEEQAALDAKFATLQKSINDLVSIVQKVAPVEKTPQQLIAEEVAKSVSTVMKEQMAPLTALASAIEKASIPGARLVAKPVTKDASSADGVAEALKLAKQLAGDDGTDPLEKEKASHAKLLEVVHAYKSKVAAHMQVTNEEYMIAKKASDAALEIETFINFTERQSA